MVSLVTVTWSGSKQSRRSTSFKFLGLNTITAKSQPMEDRGTTCVFFEKHPGRQRQKCLGQEAQEGALGRTEDTFRRLGTLPSLPNETGSRASFCPQSSPWNILGIPDEPWILSSGKLHSSGSARYVQELGETNRSCHPGRQEGVSTSRP